MTECKRPNCSRREHVEHMGLCSAHFKQKQRERIARGEWLPGRVPAGPTLEHLDKLLESGWTKVRLEKATGLTHSFFSHIGGKQSFRAATEAKILAVSPLNSGSLDYGGRHIPMIGTQRRVCALRAMGYTVDELSRESGVGPSVIKGVCKGERPYVFIDTAQAIADVFKRLQMSPPPPSTAATRAINGARRRGWVLPLAWDEDDIDNPAAQPHLRRKMSEDWYQEYLDLKAMGLNEGQVAERMGIRQSALCKRLSRRNAPHEL